MKAQQNKKVRAQQFARGEKRSAKSSNGKIGNTHSLRKRCPSCYKIRRFFEPPGDQGGTRRPRKGWSKDKRGNWICPQCTSRPRMRVADALLLDEVLKGKKYIEVNGNYYPGFDCKTQWRYRIVKGKMKTHTYFEMRYAFDDNPLQSTWQDGRFDPSQVNEECILVRPTK